MLNKHKKIFNYVLPNLLHVQRASYCWFLEKGLVQELANFSVIRDYLLDLELNFATKFFTVKPPRYTLNEAKRKDTTYSIRIFIRAELSYLANSTSEHKKCFSRRHSFDDRQRDIYR